VEQVFCVKRKLGLTRLSRLDLRQLPEAGGIDETQRRIE